VLFPVLNSKGLGIIDGTAEDMLAACRTASDNGKGIYVMKPLAGGHLRSVPQEAFQYLRDTRIIDSICTGMKSPAEVEMNVSIFEQQDVSQETLAHIETTTRRLKINQACIGCGTCVDTCDQGALSLDFSKADESKGKKAQSVVDEGKCILCGYCARVCPQFSIMVI